jgi:hypothetical protein
MIGGKYRTVDDKTVKSPGGIDDGFIQDIPGGIEDDKKKQKTKHRILQKIEFHPRGLSCFFLEGKINFKCSEGKTGYDQRADAFIDRQAGRRPAGRSASGWRIRGLSKRRKRLKKNHSKCECNPFYTERIVHTPNLSLD